MRWDRRVARRRASTFALQALPTYERPMRATSPFTRPLKIHRGGRWSTASWCADKKEKRWTLIDEFGIGDVINLFFAPPRPWNPKWAYVASSISVGAGMERPPISFDGDGKLRVLDAEIYKQTGVRSAADVLYAHFPTTLTARRAVLPLTPTPPPAEELEKEARSFVSSECSCRIGGEVAV